MHMHGEHCHDAARKNIWWAVVGNAVLAVVGLGFFLLTNSMAVGMSVLHDFGDCIAALCSYYLEGRAKQWRYWSLISALGNAVIIIVGSIWILWLAVHRFVMPEPVEVADTWMLALFGFVVNCAMAIKLNKGSSLNEQMISLHFWEDVLACIAMMMVWGSSRWVDAAIFDPAAATIVATIVLVLTLLRAARVINCIRKG